MKLLTEYLSINVKLSIIHATDNDIRKIVVDEINKLGHDANLNHIDVSKIRSFGELKGENSLGLFNGLDFYGDISRWDVHNVRDMSCLFYGNKKFNCPLNDWDVSKLEDAYCMFANCHEFNQPLYKWNVTNLKTSYEMFKYCKKFNQDISMWNLEKLSWNNDMYKDCPIKEEFKAKK